MKHDIDLEKIEKRAERILLKLFEDGSIDYSTFDGIKAACRMSWQMALFFEVYRDEAIDQIINPQGDEDAE